ncbi:hypothetical protein ACWDZ8_30550 [Streptomyces sp. NPDC003233]
MAVPLTRARSGAVIEASSLGIVTERADLSRGLHFAQRKGRTVEERYRTTSGKRLDRRVRIREIRLSFASAADVLGGRSGDGWFLGGVYAGAARTAEVPLSIGPGRRLAETIRDGADRLVLDRRVLRGGDAFSVDTTANGGFAGVACPWHPGITTCYR